MTAWILTGVPGTGKGIFYSHILKPLFGDEHVPMRSLQNIEEQFSLRILEENFCRRVSTEHSFNIPIKMKIIECSYAD